MSYKKWLAVSLAANVALVGLVVFQYHQPDQPVAIAAPTDGASHPMDEQANSSLSSPGVFDAQKALELANLEFAAREANPQPQLEYWHSAGDVELAKYEEASEQKRDEMRQHLLAKYGPAAADDPAFARLFKPLSLTHPYLSSRGQIALAKLQRTRRYASSMAGAGMTPAQVRDPAIALEQQRTFESQLRQALGAEFSEYQVRNSPLARQLRSSGAIESDKQFREAMATLEQMTPNAGSADYVRVQGRLKAILGEESYVKFSAARDQGFPGFEAAGSRRQLTREQILGAYAVVLRAQNDLIAAADDRSASGRTRPGADPQEIIDSRDREISGLVGEPAATEMMQSYSNSMVAAAQSAMNGAR